MQCVRTSSSIFIGFVCLGGCGGGASLYDAIRNDDAKAIESIAASHPSTLSRFSFSGDSPLIYAMDQGCKNAFRALLESGADPNQIGSRGQNVMTFAAAESDIYWLKTALEHGGDPNLDNRGSPQRRSTPLIVAASNGNVDALKLLIDEYSANVNYITDSDDALNSAAGATEYQAVLYLLQSGADFRRKVGRYCSFADKIMHQSPGVFLNAQRKQDFQAVIDWLSAQGVIWNKPQKDGDAWVYSK